MRAFNQGLTGQAAIGGCLELQQLASVPLAASNEGHRCAVLTPVDHAPLFGVPGIAANLPTPELFKALADSNWLEF